MYKKGDMVILYSSVEDIKEHLNVESVTENINRLIKEYGGSVGEIKNIYGIYVDIQIESAVIRIYTEIIKGYAEDQIIPITDHKYNVYGQIDPIRCTQVSDGGITFMGKSDGDKIQTQFYISEIESEYIKSKLSETNTKTPRPPVKLPKKPPLGLIRLENWEINKDNERTLDILQAMLRYSSEEKSIPKKWVKELSGRVINLMDGTE